MGKGEDRHYMAQCYAYRTNLIPQSFISNIDKQL